jgi:hypothetical protein
MDTPKLPTLNLGDLSIGVKGITGHGASRASIAICTVAGTIEAAATREGLISFALDLLNLTDQMIDDGAYSTTDTIRSGVGRVSSRYDDALKRFYRLSDRLPILQLAQRVLEKADDKTANTLLLLLAEAEATGAFPFKVAVDLKAGALADESMSQKREPGDSTH